MMRPLPCAIVCLALGAALLDAAIDPADVERKKLGGIWVATAAQRDGQPAADVIGHQIRFSDNTFQIRSKTGTTLYMGTYRVDPGKKPATIDFEHTGGELKGKVWKGVYLCGNDTLKICDNAANPQK